MKRRQILKTISILPFAGTAIPSIKGLWLSTAGTNTSVLTTGRRNFRSYIYHTWNIMLPGAIKIISWETDNMIRLNIQYL